MIPKEDILAYAWSGLVVEEISLRVHIAELRKVLGDGKEGARYITNVPSRGYCFVAPVRRSTAMPASPPVAPEKAAPVSLPHRLERMVGREDVLQELSARLLKDRFVTLRGPRGDRQDHRRRQDPEAALDVLARGVIDAGADALIVHARKAWLDGLSPKENRDIPPLEYDRGYRLKALLPHVPTIINGGIGSVAEAKKHLDHVDGVMLGSAAYQEPWRLLSADPQLFVEAASHVP